MKRRTSFVANSSSSSFIVGCAEPIHTTNDVITHWFNNRTDGFPRPFDSGILSVTDVASFCATEFEQIELVIPEDIELFVDQSIDEKLEYNYEGITISDVLDSECQLRYDIHRIIERAYEEKTGKSYYHKSTDWNERAAFEREYIKEHYKADMIVKVKRLISRMKEFKYLYAAEIGDDCNSEIEHNEVIWDVVPFCHRISNH